MTCAQGIVAAVLAGALVVGSAAAQSGSRKVGVIPRKGGGAAASGEVPGERPLLALGGIDPVTLASGSPTGGRNTVTALFDAQVYRFTDDANRNPPG